VSSRQHQKQVARARAKRRAGREQRRATRTRLVVLVMAGLLVLSLFGTALAALLDGRGTTDGVVGDDPDAAPTDPDQDAGTDGDPAAVGPCGPTPDDVPTVDSASYDGPFEVAIDPSVTYVATIETTCGTIVVELAAGESPVTANNFVQLAREGYYEGIVFHRVIPGFVAQAGDPTGTGSGGPGYRFEDELELARSLYEEAGGGYPRGAVAMANAGPDTNGSQFFIAQGDPTLLPGPDYSVFGRVVEGMDVVDAIVDSPRTVGDRPVEDVVIRSVTIEER
jgi:cyclophilin family peptidyl-prolyl cis-trans isomerase